MSTDLTLVTTATDGTPTTTSLIIAQGTETQHESVMRLIDGNLADFEQFGAIRFEIGKPSSTGGRPTRTAILTEPHATLLLTYMRNSEVVKRFKIALVKAFFELRNRVQQQSPELDMARGLIAAQQMLAAKDEQIAELAPKAEVADKILDAEGDLSVKDAAQCLTRAGIKVGERRLFKVLHEHYHWIHRSQADGKWRVYQTAIEAGWMSILPQSHYHPKTGVLVLDPPQPRVTPKGLQRILTDHTPTDPQMEIEA